MASVLPGLLPDQPSANHNKPTDKRRPSRTRSFIPFLPGTLSRPAQVRHKQNIAQETSQAPTLPGDAVQANTGTQHSHHISFVD